MLQTLHLERSSSNSGVHKRLAESFFIARSYFKGHNTQHSGHMGQTELMAEIYSKSPVRAIGKVLLMKFKYKYQ